MRQLLAVAALGLACPPTGLAQRSTAQIARSATPATVTILTLDASGDTLTQGSGFLVSSSGIIVTNHHVMAGAASAVVRLASGERFGRVEALDADSTRDIAIIKIPGFALPTLAPAPGKPEVGAPVIVIGSPHGLEQTVSEGIVSATRVIDGTEWYQVTAPISPGSSGGPVLDRQGRVLAIATAQLREGQALNFAVPVRYAMGLVRATATPRSLASVFGTAPATAGGERAPAASGRRPPLPRPAETATAAWLADTYEFVGWSHFVAANAETRFQGWYGLLLIADENTGLMIQSAVMPNEELGTAYVYPLTQAFATSTGRVLVRPSGSHAMSGYFTEDGGMVVTGDTLLVEHGLRLSDTLVASPSKGFPLDNPTGLYALKWRSRWTDSGYRSQDVVDWTGRAAVAVVGDSIWVDLTMHNDLGGDTGFFAAGPLKDGRFSLRHPRRGSTLTGWLRGGQLQAELSDKREEGAFVGALSGTRE